MIGVRECRQQSCNFKDDGYKFKAGVSPLLDEKPHLLHPEIDDPNDFFEFEIDPQNKGIRIVGIDADQRGQKTIEICKLNRQELLLARKECVVDNFANGLRGSFEDFGHDEDKYLDRLDEVVAHLKNRKVDEKSSHTLLRQYVVSSRANFHKIIMPFIKPKAQALLSVVVDAAFE